MAKQKVSFIATKYKNEPAEVTFYTKKGERVDFDAVKKVVKEGRVSFYANVKKK